MDIIQTIKRKTITELFIYDTKRPHEKKLSFFFNTLYLANPSLILESVIKNIQYECYLGLIIHLVDRDPVKGFL